MKRRKEKVTQATVPEGNPGTEAPGKVLQQITEKLLSLGSILKRLSIIPPELDINTVWE